jgi:hypothetical protein
LKVEPRAISRLASGALGSTHYKKRRDAPTTIACLYIYAICTCHTLLSCNSATAASYSKYPFASCLRYHSSSLLRSQLLL